MDNSYYSMLHLYRRQRATNLLVAKFIMLCGKKTDNNITDNRLITKNILMQNRLDIFIIYSEEIFDILDNDEIDLLKFEEILVEISDGVIIFLESYGTAAELGAFTYLDSLAKKTLVFTDVKYKNDKSFINSGPFKRIQNVTKNDEQIIFAKPILNDIYDFGNTRIFSKVVNFVNHDKNISLSKENLDLDTTNNNGFVLISPQLLIFFIVDIVFVFDFIPREAIKNEILKVLGKPRDQLKVKLSSNNAIDPDIVFNYLISFLIRWKILKHQIDKKNKNSELISLNFEEIEFRSISQGIGRILFTNKMFESRTFMSFKLLNRRRNIDLYGNIYD